MSKPVIAVLAGEMLFDSFFDGPLRARLSGLAEWRLCSGPRAEDLAGCDALITTWDSPQFGTELLMQAPRVRMIAHCGGEVKKRFARELFRELVITNTAEPMARPTAEMGVALLLASARRIVQYALAMREPSDHVYQEAHAHGAELAPLAGSEVSMIGYGRIAREIVRLTRGFDLRWNIVDPFAKDGSLDVLCRFVELEEALRASRWLIVAAAATEKTENLLNAERLKLLPDGATLINIARGSIVDQTALTAEVLAGRLYCALDVTDPYEPLPVDHPLRHHPGAIITPHVGGGGRSVRRQMAALALDSLQKYFAGQQVPRRVTEDMLARMT